MIYTITISISGLIAINFLLLVFSCNKINKNKSKKIKKPFVKPFRTTIPQVQNHLSPTGS